ncbi:MAG: hypothetical protein Q7S22_05120 [Candidatus Micrarchaeota archaeon]|nr:hypothetical protein [Candidatus Micrarchaeota archaeon]
MTNIVNIKNEIWKLIENDPSIMLDLSRGLINVRALARYCTKIGIDATEDAIISAIRRYPKETRTTKQYSNALEIVGQSVISTKSHIVSIALTKGAETQKVLPLLFSCVNYEKGETLRLVQGEESIKVLVDQRNLNKIMELIPQRLVLKVLKGLAEINMHLHPKAVETPGIIYTITGELFRNGVIMYEVMSCVPELLIFVEENELLKAYQVLFGLCHQKPKGDKTKG